MRPLNQHLPLRSLYSVSTVARSSLADFCKKKNWSLLKKSSLHTHRDQASIHIQLSYNNFLPIFGRFCYNSNRCHQLLRYTSYSFSFDISSLYLAARDDFPPFSYMLWSPFILLHFLCPKRFFLGR